MIESTKLDFNTTPKTEKTTHDQGWDEEISLVKEERVSWHNRRPSASVEGQNLRAFCIHLLRAPGTRTWNLMRKTWSQVDGLQPG